MVPTFTLCLLGSSVLLLSTTPGAQAAWCPFPRVPYGRVSPRRYSYRTWDTVSVTCNPGYTLRGPGRSTCGAASRWDPPLPECKKEVTCPRPPSIANGLHTGLSSGSFSRGVTVSYSCREGFQLLGNESITCTDSGRWSRTLPRCEAIGCQVPEVQNGKVHNVQSTYRAGETLHFDCHPGYAAEDSDEARCQPGGIWDPPLLVCHRVRPCPMPPEVANGNHNGRDTEGFTTGMSVRYTCDPGYYLVGNAAVTCRASGNWSQPRPRCQEVTCPRPPSIANGLHTGLSSGSFSRGVTVSYSCREGFQLLGNESITCTDSGRWSRTLPRCEAIGCQVPEVQNGKVHNVQSTYRAGETLHFDCHPGYAAEDSDEARCQPGGIWDPPLLVCHRVRPCPMPPEVANGNHNGRDKAFFTAGMSVRYTCDPGYYLVGNAAVTCRASGNWSQPRPRCQGTVCISPIVANGRQVGGHGLLSAPGQTVTFQCHDGYSLQGSASLSCQEDGSWQPPAPVCDRALPYHNSFSRSPGACGAPTRLQFAELNEKHRDAIDFPVGKTVQYTCLPGYAQVPGMSPTLTCLESGVWSQALEFCKRKQCSHPGEPVNGKIISLTNLQLGSTVVYSCEEGHRLIGQPSRRCEISGGRVAWTGHTPLCQRIPCEPPPDIPNGQHSGRLLSEFHYGTAVTYSCHRGFPLHGQPSIHCTTRDGYNGVWSEPLPACGEASCPVPQIQHGRILAARSAYSHRDTVTFQCDPGYAIRGHREIQCQPNNTWEPPVPVCEQAGCRAPARLGFAELKEPYRNQTVFPEGSRVEFVCQPGYSQLLGVSAASTCLRNQTWSAVLEFCKRKECPSPGNPENGRAVVLTDLLLGSKINYTCDTGYKLVGGSQRICEVSGTHVSWSGDPPLCQRVTCTAPPAIPHGTHSGGSRDTFSLGDVVTYTCTSGLAPAGNTSLSCTSADGERGTWSGTVPQCQEVRCPAPPSIANGQHSASPGARHSPGSVVLYTCAEGYSLLGNASIRCTARGTWSRPQPRCRAIGCTRPEIENGKVSGSETTYNLEDTIIFECNFGYALKGSQESQCQFGGKWHPPVPTCEKLPPCPSPPIIRNGQHDSKGVTEFVPGMTVKYHCDPGYVLAGKSSVSCLPSGVWSIPYPRCEVITCSSPSIKDGEVAEGRRAVYHPGDNVTFQCHPGFVLRGSRGAKCQPDSRWVPAVPTCQPARPCPPPPVIAHATLSAQPGTNFTSGTSVSYSCQPGFSLLGDPSVLCTAWGNWSLPYPRCAAGCGTPTPLLFAELSEEYENQTEFPVGMSVNYTCRPGYVEQPQISPTITCLENLTWSEAQEFCKMLQCPSPPSIAKGTHDSQDLEVFPTGMVVNYSCEPGYSLQGQASIYCTDSGNWSLPLPQCAGGCGAPPNLTFAELTRQYRNQLEFAVGDTVSYSCRPGHSRRPGVPQTLTCLPNHTWSEALEFCKRKQCRHPEPPRNGRVVVLTDLLFGSAVSHTCDEGYRLVGQSHRRCEILGRDVAWTGLPPTCQRVVCPAPQVQNGRVAVPKPRYTYGDSVTFKCRRGFTLRGHPTSQCQGDRRWHPPVPVCEQVLHCSKPADITHGSFRGPAKAVFTVGTSVNYICEPGFSLLGTASIYCTASGAWSHPPPVCQAVTCLQPPNISHGRLKGNTSATFPSGAAVSYSCDPGYSLVGNAFINCTGSGSWSQPLPQCREIRCEFPDVQGVKKAIKGSTYRSGTNITLECDDGYVLEGISHTQCQEDFSWDPPVPACKLMSPKPGSVGLGVAAAAVLLLLGAGVVWKIISKQKEGYYRTYENYNYRTPLNPDTEHKGSCLP
ncbi:complement receptor type 2 isoform X2 [Haemorhous mexicanus]|uniref:complement receptor type 2 isoform X2 n=1 Tax=Haemorhous mexicanus TaxID=30427 RepID=UPI0028BF2392|nr:complement receptor type 2 isoform X2 [Haemorhous mexicanus]